MIILKTPEQIEGIRESCKIVAYVLSELEKLVKPGVTTAGLNRIAEELTRERGGYPGFKGYRGFPFSICASVNEQIVHGFSNDKPLKEGDILSIDFGVLKNGWYGDSALTIPVGEISEETKRLLNVTETALQKGLFNARPFKTIGDISWAIQNYVESKGLSVVREFVGHGIGKDLHEDPQIPNFGKQGEGMMLKAGMVIAIEPMVNLGTYETKTLSDGWTTVTKDGKLSAHFEHTAAITENGPEILTKRN
jgi:methionyl aminopeptidase